MGFPSTAGCCGESLPLLPAGNPAPCHVVLSELAASGSLWATQMMGAALLWAACALHKVPVAVTYPQKGLLREGVKNKISRSALSHPGISGLWNFAPWGHLFPSGGQPSKMATRIGAGFSYLGLATSILAIKEMRQSGSHTGREGERVSAVSADSLTGSRLLCGGSGARWLPELRSA